MSFIKDLYKDEIRDGFLVTTDRKKLWNAEIGLIVEFQRICKKYNLKYFAYAGTLLGAARHKGFIPWDDDVDFGMLRPDYEKFKQIAAKEIKFPYYLDTWFCHEVPRPGHPTFIIPFAKLRDSRTSMIEFPHIKNMNQGIWIDIFPFDNAPPFTNQKDAVNFAIRWEVLAAILNPHIVSMIIETKSHATILTYECLTNFMHLPFQQQLFYFEKLSFDFFRNSGYVLGVENMFAGLGKKVPIEYFDDIVETPFENITIAAPRNYDMSLKAHFGDDWRKPIITHSHASDFSADISYVDYFNLISSDLTTSDPGLGGGVIDLDIGILSAA